MCVCVCVKERARESAILDVSNGVTPMGVNTHESLCMHMHVYVCMTSCISACVHALK